jgi:hypothetical protein
MELKEALELLEITDVASIRAEDLKHIRKRAMRRWHPDRIAHSNPSPALLYQYEDNFKNIDLAMARIEAFVRDGITTDYRNKRTIPESQTEPEEIVTRNAPENQTTLKEAWAQVKAKQFEFHQEDVVLTEGISIQAALDEDLREKVPAIALFSLSAGFFYLVIGLLGGSLFAAVLEVLGLAWAGYLILLGIIGAWITQAASCLAILLPLSRFWMPPQLADFTVSIVNATLKASDSWLDDQDGVGKWAHGALSVFSFLAHWLIAFPLYKVAGVLLGQRRIGRNVVRMSYYGGYRDRYIERLIQTPISSLSLDELFDLSSAASKFKLLRPRSG